MDLQAGNLTSSYHGAWKEQISVSIGKTLQGMGMLQYSNTSYAINH